MPLAEPMPPTPSTPSTPSTPISQARRYSKITLEPIQQADDINNLDIYIYDEKSMLFHNQEKSSKSFFSYFKCFRSGHKI